jgi:hypothetical protein
VEGGGARQFLPPEPPGAEPDLSPAPRRWLPPTEDGWQPPQQQWSYATRPHEPDNGAAVGGFVTSIAAAAALAISFGFLSPISLIAAPFGIHFSRKGKRAVEEGRTRKHAGLARAGFIIGIIVLVLSVIALVGVILFVIHAANNNDSGNGGGDGNGNGFDSTSAALGMAVLRAGAQLVS